MSIISLRVIIFIAVAIALALNIAQAGAEQRKEAASVANPPTDLVSLETDAVVATKSFRRELDPEAAAKAAKIARVERTASGVVVARGTNGMAFSSGTNPGGETGPEFWLPFEAGLKLVGYRSLSEIHDGDVVNVTYEEKEDDHELFLKRVTLIRQHASAEGSQGSMP